MYKAAESPRDEREMRGMREIKMLLAGGLAHLARHRLPRPGWCPCARRPHAQAASKAVCRRGSARAQRSGRRRPGLLQSSAVSSRSYPHPALQTLETVRQRIVAPRLRVLQRRRGGLFRLRGPVDGSGGAVRERKIERHSCVPTRAFVWQQRGKCQAALCRARAAH